MDDDTVKAFINWGIEPSDRWWHSNRAIWEAYLGRCEAHGMVAVGGANALMKYLASQLEFELQGVRKTVAGEQVRGKAGLYVEGAPGVLLESWRGEEVGVYFERTHGGQPVLEIVEVDGYEMTTEPCPACGEQHTHGREQPLLDGEIEYTHRASHCPTPERPGGYYLALPGELPE